MQLVNAEMTPTGKTLVPGAVEPRGEYSLGRNVPSLEFGIEIVQALEQPGSVRFGALIDPRLRFKRPIRVDLSWNAGAVVAQWPDIEEFGYGPTMSAALNDLGKTLAELYFSLNENRERLSPHLDRVREKLAHFIELRPRR